MKETVVMVVLVVLILAGVIGLVKFTNNRSANSSSTGSWGIVSYNGHSYVKHVAGYGKGITHNPDCECKGE